MTEVKKQRGRPTNVQKLGAIHYCSACDTSAATETDLSEKFYKSTSKLFKRNGRITLCKECLKNLSVNDDGSFDLEKFKDVLHYVDKPLIFEVFNSSMQETLKVLEKEGVKSTDEVYEKNGKRFIQIYMKNIALPQYVSRGWHDSDLFKDDKKSDDLYSTERQKEEEKETMVLGDKWGSNHSLMELRRFENKYKRLLPSYKQLNRGLTAIHEDMFMQWVKYSVLSDIALENGDDKRAKELSDLATKAATNAKMNPSQFKAEDFTDGINAFTDYAKMAEKVVDIIPVLPQFRYAPNDAVDFIMWTDINYMRKVLGLGEASYEEIYGFYDEKKRKYIESYGDPHGIFDGDPTEQLRDKVKQFLKMPEDLEHYDDIDANEGEGLFADE